MMVRIGTIVVAALALGACGEKPQTVSSKKSDEKAWVNGSAAYAASGFKAGDAATWETQIRARNQGQNEYNRTPAR